MNRSNAMCKALDELAADQGESGLFISLSKPFHRLLRYPLMFQNLLFVSCSSGVVADRKLTTRSIRIRLPRSMMPRSR